MSSHLTLEELLAVEDGDPSADPAAHLEHCSTCSAQRHEIARRRDQLRALPVLRPSEDRWLLVRGRVLASRRKRRLVATAIAAGLVALALSGAAVLQKRARPPEVDEVAQLIEESQRREEKLRTLREPEVMNLASADTIVQIEEQIAVVDECIAEIGTGPESRRLLAVLWQTRISLLDALAQMRQPALARLTR